MSFFNLSSGYPLMVSKGIEEDVIGRFGRDNADGVIKELDRYGSSPYHKEVDRVHRMILRMARNDLTKISRLVDVAIDDYRDILVSEAGVHKGEAIDKKVYIVLVIFGVLCFYLFLKP